MKTADDATNLMVDARTDIRHISAVDGVLEHLRSLIHRGALGPGDRLPPERELATRLGIGRITLREAIRALHTAGYVTTRRGARGGTFVTELRRPYEQWAAGMVNDLEDLDDILEYRTAVEGRAARLAAARRTDDDLERMRLALEATSVATTRSAFRQADNAFHSAVAAASRSERLARAMESARGQLFAPTDQLVYQELVELAVDQHNDIYQVIVSLPASRSAARELALSPHASMGSLESSIGQPTAIRRGHGAIACSYASTNSRANPSADRMPGGSSAGISSRRGAL